MTGTFASVSTLWTTVGIPKRPRSAGNGGRADTVPRRPWRQASSAVSSPTTYEPAPSTTRTSNAKPEPRMSSPSRPAARAAAIAASSAGRDSGYSERTSTTPSLAPTAYPASAIPSSTSAGLRSIRCLSMYEPGSPSSPLQTM